MEPHNKQVKTKGQRQWPDINGVWFSDIRLGTIAWWGQVSPLLSIISHSAAFSHPQGKLDLCSRQERISMGILLVMIFLHKLIIPLTSLRASPKARLKASLYLTMCPAIKSVCRMPYQHNTWRKVCWIFWFWLTDWLTAGISQDWKKGGCTTLMVHACTMAYSQMVPPNLFIFLKTIPPCPAGSKAWKLSFGNVVCGPTEMLTSLPSAQVFVAPLVALTIVINDYFFCSPILYLRSPSFKSWSSCTAIYVTSIQNITVSLILLNSTREQQSSVSMQKGMQQWLTR